MVHHTLASLIKLIQGYTLAYTRKRMKNNTKVLLTKITPNLILVSTQDNSQNITMEHTKEPLQETTPSSTKVLSLRNMKKRMQEHTPASM